MGFELRDGNFHQSKKYTAHVQWLNDLTHSVC